ncbi:MAG: hypothetical protein QHC81_01155, partial [Achromobacter sp.]|nr:hypothetical protein [Achromobacter sp.]
MTNQNNAAQAAEQAIKAAIRKAYDDGYNDAKMAPDNCSTYCVERAVRLDSAALLSKLRAPVSDIREGFELAYAADADDPACAADLSHFTNGWRACIMSQVRAPVADSTLPLEQALYELVNKIDTGLDTGDLLQDARRASTVLDAIMTSGDLVACAHTFFKECGEDKWRERYERSLDFRIGWNTCLDAIAEAQANRAASVASAPVAKPKRAPLDDWRVQAIAECLETEWDDMTPAGAE